MDMEISEDKKGIRSQSQGASGQIVQGQKGSFAADDTSGRTRSELMDGAVQLSLKEPLFMEKDSNRSPTMNDRTETLQSGSADSPNCQIEVSACDKEHNSPRTGQQPRDGSAILRDRGNKSLRNVPSLKDKPIRDASTTKRPAGFEIASFTKTPGDEGPQRPSSNPAGTRDSSGDEIVPASYSTAEHEPTWIDRATQTAIGPTTFKAGSARPTSVPNFKSQSGSRGRREGPAYPNYPDQSFAALQSQYYPPPYQPHPLRTRSSQSSHNASYSSDSSAKGRDFSTMPSGAKTVGNTPAQSPGLFSPSVPRNRPATQDSEDSAVRTPTLHPSQNLHLQAPIETHKLLKDVDPISGRKTLNDYELFEKLGSGQHGTVKLGRHLNNQQTVAVKIVRRFSKRVRLGKYGDPSDTIKKEVAILKKARHPHVVSLLEVIDDDEYGKVYLVLEYVARGEIVWRKKTDKAVATFEMKRIKREKAGGINETFEHEEVEHFNQGAPARRLEKARNLGRHKGKSQARPDAEVAGPYWSLEYGEENEEDPFSGREAGPGVSTGATSLVPLQDGSSLGAHEISPQSSTPKQLYTPKSAPFDAMLLETVTPESLSRQESTKALSELRLEDPSADLMGTMYGPYVSEGSIPDEPLRWRLQDLIDEQTQWTEEEEEYMYVPCLTIEQIQTAFRQTVLGLEYLHFQGIIHRDIKPANLLWTDNFEVKISDFGVSYLGKPLRRGDNNEELSEADAADKMEAVELAKTVGTPAFYAPELCDPDLFDFEKNPERPRITGQIDVWALGVTLYCMIFGRLPFVDSNEMGMYEKIAREEVFIPRVRLRGVENSDKDPETNYKRLDDVLEYEAVDDELRDLIERLLDKDPTKRISIKEVKHHPWVLRGISDQDIWVDETDPSVQSQGKRIEISNEDVASAVVPLTLVDRVKAGLRRLGSVVRGREGRKRTDSNVKTPDSPSSTALKGGGSGQEGRRPSLRGDEQIFSALRASREGSEHPLSQSVAASPEINTNASYFDSATEATADSSNNSPRASRPTMSERTLSSAESARTVKAAVPAIQESIVSPGELFTSLTTPIDTSSSSSLGGIFHGAGRRFVHSMRSRERGRDRDSPSRSSRSSSADTSASIIEDPHGSPSLAISSAIAAGHVDQPPILREEPSPADLHRAAPTSSPTPSRSQVESSSEAFQKAQEQNFRRQVVEATRDGPTDVGVPLGSPETTCPASPDDDLFYDQQNRATAVGVSSSSDQMASGISESFSHPSVPSVVSGASSFSATIDTDGHLPLFKETSPSTLVPRNVSESSDESVLADGHQPKATKASGADDDEAGYNGEGEMDSDSDEDLLMMGPKK